MEKYTYFYKLRGPSPGAQPKGFIAVKDSIIIKDGERYRGYVVYDRPLKKEEIEEYDLVAGHIEKNGKQSY